MTTAGADVRRRIGIAGCKHTTRDLILGLARGGIRIDHCLSIAPEKGQSQQVAGYYDLRPFLDQQGIPLTIAQKYSLNSEADRQACLALKLDLLLVMGWQRLIPDWWLKELPLGAFGMHGSSKPLPHGRGRSPMNWSLLQNKTIFFTHLFRYLPGVDDGPILGVQTFDITPFDDCHTLHLKNQVAMTRLCVELLPDYLDGRRPLTPQAAGKPTYYPKRTAEDGLIFWSDATAEIHNLVRAVTKPFPGAFTYLDDDPRQQVLVWRAIPFDTQLSWPNAEPGEIVEVFYDGAFVVKTGDASLLVQEAEGRHFTAQDIGRRFGSLGKPRKQWPDLP